MTQVWVSPVPDVDDFNDFIMDEFIDGKTRHGPWAMMTPKSWEFHGIGRLGTGYGQRYKLTHDINGRKWWSKVEG